jgi:putative FmdB family regulatory protein
MPTYEYACRKCGIVEVFQSIKEDALTRCPTCKSAGFQRMISSGGGVIFKGSGFWETDYNRSKDYRKHSKTETDATLKKQPASKPEPKPEPKPQPATAPAAKPASKPEKS